MFLRTLMQYMIDEKEKEAPLFKELRNKYPDFGEKLLMPASVTGETKNPLIGFASSNDWKSLIEFYTGHRSSKITSIFLSKLLIEYETEEYEYGIDKILMDYQSNNTPDRSRPNSFTVLLDKKKKKKMIDRFFLEKAQLAKRCGLNIGQIQNVLENHNSVGEKHTSRRYSQVSIFGLTNIKDLIGTEKTYRILLTWNGDTGYGTLSDSVYMFETLVQHSKNPALGYKIDRIKDCPISNVKDFHDFLVQEQNYVERKIGSMPIQYTGFRAWLSKLKIEGLETYIPEQTGDLVEIGQKLHNCIGTYKKRVANGSDTIVAFKQGDQFKMAMNVYIVEPKFAPTERGMVNTENMAELESMMRSITPGEVRIVEFKENYNKTVQDETKNLVEKQLVELFTEYKKELLDNKTAT